MQGREPEFNSNRRLNGCRAAPGDGKRVVTASFDNTARIWDADSGKEIALLKGHTD